MQIDLSILTFIDVAVAIYYFFWDKNWKMGVAFAVLALTTVIHPTRHSTAPLSDSQFFSFYGASLPCLT